MSSVVAKECIAEAIGDLNAKRVDQPPIILKEEQETAVEKLLMGQDVLAILPTGFGKSMIFTIFALAKHAMLRRSNEDAPVCVIVISPLTSITADQISEMSSLGLYAAALDENTSSQIQCTPPDFIYSSAENAIDQHFLEVLRNDSELLHKRVSLVVVDESHTVETWTGKRKAKTKGKRNTNQAFRSAFGKLSLLRSMCRKDCPVLALTGTADKNTQDTICSELLLKQPTVLFVSPNRKNLRFSVKKVKKIDMLVQLDWLICLIRECGMNTPKTIIFCDTLYTIARVANYLMMKLGDDAFEPKSSRSRNHCLVGIIHSAIQNEYKERLINSLKGDGSKRIAIATTSLSMGVNFPNIRYIIMFGLPRSLLDLHQQAGRAGRDGQKSDVLVIFYGQQVSHCDDDVREFVNTTDCYRKASYQVFDPSITELLPGHDCCNYCTAICSCDVNGCNQPIKIFEKKVVEFTDECQKSRNVSERDKQLLSESLQELTNASTMSPFGNTSSHGFSKELILDVVSNCHRIFTQDDIYHLMPVFSKAHSNQILGVLNEIFDDIDESSLVSEMTDDQRQDVQLISGLDDLISMSDYVEYDNTDFEENEGDHELLYD